MSNEINKPTAVTFDEEKLRLAVPFELEKTAMPGVFTIPGLPAGFDPRTARPIELMRWGFPWKRPDAAADPVARALWNRVTSREWRFEDRADSLEDVQAGASRRHHRPP